MKYIIVTKYTHETVEIFDDLYKAINYLENHSCALLQIIK